MNATPLNCGCLVAAVLSVVFPAFAAPEDYRADASTPERRAALIAELWAHDLTADTRLWPEGRVPLRRDDKPLRFLEHELSSRNLVVSDINDPTFTLFPAAGEGAKPVVVILPGGGYAQLGWNKEGTEVAAWLNSLGVSAAVLLYRAPLQRDAALCDVQRAIGLLRRDAAKYAVDPKHVGVIGFSAGANLAVRAATNWRTRAYPRVDDADDQSCRPDFALPIYPWDLRPGDCGKQNWIGLNLSPKYPVDAETPPMFIAQTEDDFCQPETSIGLYLALRSCGIAAEMHLYPSGGHGYGLRRLGRPCDVWSDSAALWLKTLLKLR